MALLTFLLLFSSLFFASSWRLYFFAVLHCTLLNFALLGVPYFALLRFASRRFKVLPGRFHPEVGRWQGTCVAGIRLHEGNALYMPDVVCIVLQPQSTLLCVRAYACLFVYRGIEGGDNG